MSIIEGVHDRGFLLRDVAANNFIAQGSKLFIVDFGHCKRYLHPHTGIHAPIKQKYRGIQGQTKFASKQAHLGYSQSRRDDMQSLAYLLVYLAKGCLPWQGIKGITLERKLEIVKEIKDCYSAEDLCAGLPGIK